MDRYIGLDAHSSSCTVAVIGPSGRRLQSRVLETNARALISFLKVIPNPRRLCLQEGTHAGWLHEMLAPHVQEIVVASIRQSRGPKDDKRDAFGLAEGLRIGAIQMRVYKGLGEFGQLRELSRGYSMVVSDSVRVQNRIKSLYRSRGIPASGKEVYAPAAREKWLRKLPTRSRPLAEILYLELDGVRDLQKRAEKEMLAEARKHKITRILMTCPGMGSIRVAQMLPIVVTPHRSSNKRSFWAYGGLAIVMRSSSDWARARDGSWVRVPVQQTRGLNRNHNHTLKRIFKGAATTVIGRARREDLLYRHYQQLLDGGTKPNLAKLSIARQIASIILAMWRSELPGRFHDRIPTRQRRRSVVELSHELAMERRKTMKIPDQSDSTSPERIDSQETIPFSPGDAASRPLADPEGRDQALPRQIGRYAIQKELGRGGMGRVYLAEDAVLERQVALKVLPAEWAQRSESRARFEREAKLLAAMNHPKIATVFSLERAEDTDFITMEVVEGETLAHRLAGGPLPHEEVLPILRQIAKALEGAHKKGIVHRDLKPQNIMVDTGGSVKVLDFGLALTISEEAGEVAAESAGTPGYMSPEQLGRGSIDPRTDIWAFGCILYECLGGLPVFPGRTPADRITATLNGKPDLKRLPGETPVRLRTLVERCLAQDIEQRPPTMLEVRQEIEEAIEQNRLRDSLLGREEEIDTERHNLRRALTPFVGRRRELDELKRLSGEHRLVTLIGAGGSGKSRLALEFAWGQLGSLRDGAWFVSLASLSDPTLVPSTVAEVLEVTEEPNRTLVDTLADHLAEKDLLLVLDNCEHLLEACAQLAEALRRTSGKTRILATSREPLHLAEEVVYPVATLPLPPEGDKPNLRELAETESVQLFLQRGRAADPSFALTTQNAMAVIQICRQLDGIPLALELAAARIRALPVEEIASRLDQRFRILARGAASSQPQHQTLEALFQWSYNHLSDAEKAVFRRLSAFQGGWTLDALEPVCADEAIPEWEILDLFLRLADQSLLERVVEASNETERARYRMLQTVQAYARERLREASEETATLRRHRDHFLALAEEAELKGPQKASWLSRLAGDHDNLRAALETCARDEEDPELGLRLIAAIGEYWHVRGHFTEGRTACRRHLDRAPEGLRTKLQAKVYSAAGLFAWRQRDYAEARHNHEASLDILRELGDRRGVAMSLNNLGILAYEQGDLERARELQEESLEIRRELGDQRGLAMSLGNLGNLALEQRDYTRATELYEESMAITRELGESFFTAVALNNLGILAYGRADCDRAREVLEEGLEISRKLRYPSGIINGLHYLGLVARKQNHWEEAAALHRESLQMLVDLKELGGIAGSLERIAILAADEEDYARGARLMGAAAALREGEGLASNEPDFLPAEVAGELAAVRSALGDVVFEEEWSRGRSLSWSDAVDCALGKS